MTEIYVIEQFILSQIRGMGRSQEFVDGALELHTLPFAAQAFRALELVLGTVEAMEFLPHVAALALQPKSTAKALTVKEAVRLRKEYIDKCSVHFDQLTDPQRDQLHDAKLAAALVLGLEDCLVALVHESEYELFDRHERQAIVAQWREDMRKAGSGKLFRTVLFRKVYAPLLHSQLFPVHKQEPGDNDFNQRHWDIEQDGLSYKAPATAPLTDDDIDQINDTLVCHSEDDWQEYDEGGFDESHDDSAFGTVEDDELF